jgi:hypothetical protein
MYARVTHFKYSVARRAEFDAEVEKFRARIENLDGMIDFYICGEEPGNGVAISFFNSREAAENTRSFSQAAWAVLEGLYGGTPTSHHFDHVRYFPGPMEDTLPSRGGAGSKPLAGKPRIVVNQMHKREPELS